MSCHAAARGGLGDWRGVFTARPVIWVDAPRAAPTASDLSCPAYVRFDDATTDLEREIRDGKLRRQERQAAQNARFERLRRELPGSIQKGRVRFIGADGVYIVELADSNAILRDARGIALRVGDEIVVRVVGEGGVPEVEVV